MDNLEEDKNFSLTGFQIRSFLLFVTFDIMLKKQGRLLRPYMHSAHVRKTEIWKNICKHKKTTLIFVIV